MSATTGTGNAASISVSSISGLGTGTYIKLEDPITQSSETTKIIGVSSGSVSADLSWSHLSGSRLVKMQIPQLVKNLVKVTAAIMASRYMIGSTYTFATSYSYPEHTVTKGVPYPHFEKVYNSLVKQREALLKILRPQTSVG